MKELVEHTEMTLGPVDILVNCVGVMYYTMMKNLHRYRRCICVCYRKCSR